MKLGILTILLLLNVSLKSSELNIYTHRHYEADKILYDKFFNLTGIKINVIKGSADQLMERLLKEGENTPADILITVDAGRLHRAKNLNILQSVETNKLRLNVPVNLRDPDGYWYGLTIRARVIIYSKERVNVDDLSSYEDLASPKWKGKILSRSSSNIYNQSLMASIIESNGSNNAYLWAKNVRDNMARAPRGNDRDQIRAVANGIGDLAIVNTYYVGKMKNSIDIKDKELIEKVNVFFPNQNDRGTHINVSGAGVVRYSKNKNNAIKFLEFLTSDEVQKIFAEINYEYPLNFSNNQSKLLESWGIFKYDKVNLSVLGEKNNEAVKIFDRAGWE